MSENVKSCRNLSEQSRKEHSENVLWWPDCVDKRGRIWIPETISWFYFSSISYPLSSSLRNAAWAEKWPRVSYCHWQSISQQEIQAICIFVFDEHLLIKCIWWFEVHKDISLRVLWHARTITDSMLSFIRMMENNSKISY